MSPEEYASRLERIAVRASVHAVHDVLALREEFLREHGQAGLARSMMAGLIPLFASMGATQWLPISTGQAVAGGAVLSALLVLVIAFGSRRGETGKQLRQAELRARDALAKIANSPDYRPGDISPSDRIKLRGLLRGTDEADRAREVLTRR